MKKYGTGKCNKDTFLCASIKAPIVLEVDLEWSIVIKVTVNHSLISDGRVAERSKALV